MPVISVSDETMHRVVEAIVKFTHDFGAARRGKLSLENFGNLVGRWLLEENEWAKLDGWAPLPPPFSPSTTLRYESAYRWRRRPCPDTHMHRAIDCYLRQFNDRQIAARPLVQELIALQGLVARAIIADIPGYQELPWGTWRAPRPDGAT